MATRTANTGSNNWNTNGAWVGGVQPTAADDVIIPASATVTVPGSTTVQCRSLTLQASGTLVQSAAGAVINVGDGTAGAGNVALSLSSSATYTTSGANGSINLISTSATQQTITTGGKLLANLVINGAGSSYVLADNLSFNTTGQETLTITAGTFDTANYTLDIGILSSAGALTRTITLGSSAITLRRNGTAISMASTNLTITANTAVFTSVASPTLSCGGINWNGASFVCSSFGSLAFVNGGTWKDVTLTGTSSKTVAATISTGNLTCTGTFTANGNSSVNRLLIQTEAAGTSRTITAASVSTSNTDWMDITGAGAGSWDLSAITGLSGDCGGNSGITFTTPAAQTFDSTAGNWSTAARWTSRVPLPQDDVTINSSSGNVTLDMPRCGKNTTFSGYTRTATWSNAVGQTFYGSLTLSSGMTNTFGNTVNWVLAGRGTLTFDSAGKIFNGINLSTTISAPGGSYTLASAYTTGHGVTHLAGTFDTGNYTLTASSFTTSGTIARTLNLGSSTINLTATTNTIWTASGSNLTLNPGTSNIIVTTVGTGSRTFAGGGYNYNNFTYTVAGSTSLIPITGANTFNTITLDKGHLISFPVTVQNNIKTISGSGSSFNYLRLTSQTGSYVSIPDSAALSWTGDFDLRARLAPDAWAQTNMHIAGKRTNGSSGISWVWSFNATSKQLSLGVSSSGTSSTSVNSSTSVSFSDGQPGWIRVMWRASDGRVQFFTAADSISMPSSWTQLGVDRTAAVGSIFDSTAPLVIGALDTSTSPVFTGNFYRFQARNNILDDGTGIQCDVDFTSKTFGADTFTESSSNAATVTINGDHAKAGDGRIFIKSSTDGTPTFLQFYDTPQTTDGYAWKDIYSVVPRKIFATNSFDKTGNLNMVFGSAVSEPYIAWQQNVTGSGSSTAVTLPFTPQVGDLLVVGFGNSSNGTGTITPPSGFTLDKGVSATVAMRIYSKISDGTETTLTFTSTLAPAVTTLQAYCIRGFSGTPAVDVTDSNTGTAVTSSSTGSGATNTATPALALAMIQGSGAMNATVSATNSFEWVRPVTEITTARTLVKPLSSTGSNSSTLTWTTARNIDFELVIYKFNTIPPRYGFTNFQGPGIV